MERSQGREVKQQKAKLPLARRSAVPPTDSSTDENYRFRHDLWWFVILPYVKKRLNAKQYRRFEELELRYWDKHTRTLLFIAPSHVVSAKVYQLIRSAINAAPLEIDKVVIAWES